MYTLGSISTEFTFYPSFFNVETFCHDFQITPDIDILFDGILGNDFLSKSFSIDFNVELLFGSNMKTYIYYDQNRFYLSPRSETVINIQTDKSNFVGQIEKFEIENGVYVSDCITQTDSLGLAKVTVLNTKEDFVRLKQACIQIKSIPETIFQVNNLTNEDRSPNRWNKIKANLRIDHLNTEERESIYKLCKNNIDLFHLEGDLLGHTIIAEHHIPIEKNVRPIHTKTYRFPKVHEEEVKSQIGKMLSQNIIKPSNSPWSSPLWVVPKKLDSSGKTKWRIVIDYRKLNDITIGDNYPLPNISDILDQLGASKYFTTLDLASGFHQIPMAKEDSPKTAFTTPFGHYEYTRMPFGLKNAPAAFQRLMNSVLTGMQGIKCFVYLDDIVVYASSIQDHEQKLSAVFKQLKDANLRLQPDKCEFLRQEVIYLGHVISKNGVQPNPEKTAIIDKFPVPKTEKDIKSFLGLVGYYRRFIPDFSKISQKLTKLLRKDTNFEWHQEQQEAFDSLRNYLKSEPILQYPDFSKPFILTTDASDYAIGAILSQKHGNKNLPIAYASRTLNRPEGNYSTTEKECLSIVWAVKNFRPYLYGRHFDIFCDHRSLTWLFNVKDPGSKLVRWRLKLEEYDYTINYKPGIQNGQADYLSRIKPDEIPTNVNPLTTEDIQEILKEIPQQPCTSSSMLNTNENNQEQSENVSSDEEIEEITAKSIRDPKGVILNFTDSHFESPTYSNLLLNSTDREKLSDTNTKAPKILLFQVNKQKTIHLIIKENQWEDASLEDVTNLLEEALPIINKFKNVYYSKITDTNATRIMKLLSENFENSDKTLIFLDESTKIKIPKPQEIPDILNSYHDTSIGGHAGILKMLKNIKQSYKWKNMAKDVENYVKKCKKCQLNKINRHPTKNPMVITTTSKRSFEKIFLDIVGPLPETSQHNKYILSIQDDLTKFTIFSPLKTAEANEVASTFFKHFISKFGIPLSILTDQGTNFMSNIFKNLCKMLKITKLNTSPYHPQTNGALERVHATLAEYLRNFTEKRKDWDEWLDNASFSYNTNVHTSTNHSPYELVFGYKPQLPTSITSTNDLTYDEYTDHIKRRLYLAHQETVQNLLKQKEKSKTNYDKKLNPKAYSKGDKVLIKNFKRSGKLTPLYEGPYIVQSANETNIIIKKNDKSIKININNTKPFLD